MIQHTTLFTGTECYFVSITFCFAQDGQTALSIAENLGYKPVVDLLKDVTDVLVSPATKKRKFNLAVPETMQEAAMSDLEDEGIYIN